MQLEVWHNSWSGKWDVVIDHGPVVAQGYDTERDAKKAAKLLVNLTDALTATSLREKKA